MFCFWRLLTIEEGQEFAESGTSASTPVAAAVIALLNDYLISQGKSPLGFANPWLYATGLQGELLQYPIRLILLSHYSLKIPSLERHHQRTTLQDWSEDHLVFGCKFISLMLKYIYCMTQWYRQWIKPWLRYWWIHDPASLGCCDGVFVSPLFIRMHLTTGIAQGLGTPDFEKLRNLLA